MSKHSLLRTEKQYDNLLTENLEDSPFYRPFKEMNFTKGNLVSAIRLEAKRLISEEINPAFEKLKDFVLGEYMNETRPGIGLVSLPNGQALYQKCLEVSTTMLKGIDAESLHKSGLEELKELKERLFATADTIGLSGLGFNDLKAAIKAVPSQAFESKEELLNYIKDLINNRINPTLDQVIPKEFLTDSLYKVDVKATSPGSGAFAYYFPASRDRTRNATYYINLDKVENFRKFELPSLTMHEANPGHHFELTVFRHAFKYPEFMEAPKFNLKKPSGIASYGANVEGWGLYAEYLGQELGIYKDPYDLIGYLGFEMLRAARLVVDTGIHHYGWSRDKSIDFLRDNTFLAEDLLASSIDRYTTWPAQAVTYKVGQRKIKAMRKHFEEQDPNFDLPQFHKNYLACLGPQDLLQECIENRSRR